MTPGSLTPKYRHAPQPSFNISTPVDPRYSSVAQLAVTEAMKRAAGIVIVENCGDEDGLRTVLAELGYEVRS